MPFYEAGEHKVDHPPLFACREHKQFLKLRADFIDEMVKSLEDMVPSNLHECAAPYVGGDTNAFRLPEYLIPPRVLIYNPEHMKGASALPFTLVFIDKRFIGIPAAYLTADRFDGCNECKANPPASEAPRQQKAPTPAAAGPGGARPHPTPARPMPAAAGAGAGPRPGPSQSNPNMPAVKPRTGPANPNQSGPMQAPPRPAGQPPAPVRKPGPGPAPAPSPAPRPPQR